MQSLVARISNTFAAYCNCVQSNNVEWEEKHRNRLTELLNLLPSGSGWDLGTKFDMDKSSPQKLVFYGSYHHMNDAGMYDGWTDHTIIVTPVFGGFTIKVTGKNRNSIKEYLGDIFHHALS